MVLLLPFESAKEKVGLLTKNLPFEHEVLEPIPEIEEMYSDKRDQYRVEGYVKKCAEVGKKENDITLGITDKDLFTRKLNFVFGSAQVQG